MKTAFKTSNPALSSKSFGGFVGARAAGANMNDAAGARPDAAAMTIQGAVDKTAILLAVLIFTAIWPWKLFFDSRNPELLLPWLAIGGIGGFVIGMVTIFKKTWAPVTAPIYAACEGLVLGSISALFELRYPGIAIKSVALTFGVLLTLLVAYRTGALRATAGFKRGVIAATGAIVIVYLGSFVLGFFGVNVSFMNSSSPLSIGISLVIVGVAALNLVLDFDLIEQGAKLGAPKYMEWYGAFALLMTLVWLYLEILRLLAKLNDRR
ncbi:MAG TPA: Bax inhibitor-1/YccA family protein [Polyangia bacterium]|nr:Bax inhibitor-1/YccA family protein [Polyangia bacterium]